MTSLGLFRVVDGNIFFFEDSRFFISFTDLIPDELFLCKELLSRLSLDKNYAKVNSYQTVNLKYVIPIGFRRSLIHGYFNYLFVQINSHSKEENNPVMLKQFKIVCLETLLKLCRSKCIHFEDSKILSARIQGIIKRMIELDKKETNTLFQNKIPVIEEIPKRNPVEDIRMETNSDDSDFFIDGLGYELNFRKRN